MNILYQIKEHALNQIETELRKAGMINEPTYSFTYLGWVFKRTRKHWKVSTSTTNGLTVEQGLELHNTPFPSNMFDEEKNSKFGHYIRLAGHAGAPSPSSNNYIWTNNGKCVDYHIDNQCSFNFFVSFLRKVNKLCDHNICNAVNGNNYCIECGKINNK